MQTKCIPSAGQVFQWKISIINNFETYFLGRQNL